MITKYILAASFAFILLFPHCSFAEGSPAKKMGRGLTNILSAPVEIPKQIKAYWHEGGKITQHISFWIFSGMVKGIVNTATRMGSGIWDVATFPLEKPENYDSLIKPDFVFDAWPTPQNSTVPEKLK